MPAAAQLKQIVSRLAGGFAKADDAQAHHRNALTKLDAADYDFKQLAAELNGIINQPAPSRAIPAQFPAAPHRRRRRAHGRTG